MTDVIEGRTIRKTSNALSLAFRDGPGDPIGVAVQSAGDGRESKLGVLFGFKNGGVGTHVLTYADGGTVSVQSRNNAPTLIERGDGVALASVERGETSTARDAGGTDLLRFLPHPDGAKTLEAFRLMVTAPDGSDVGRLDVIRTVAGWSLGKDLLDTYIWWDKAHLELKVPFLGTRLELTRVLSETERDVLLAACVDIAIGLRPYVKDMS